MTIPITYIGTEGDRCSCGRRQSIRHCPQCGSFRVKIQRIKSPDGIPIDGFICIPCGFRFTDDSRVDCKAPLYATKSTLVALDILQAHSNGQSLSKHEQALLNIFDPSTKRFKTS